MFFNIIRSKNYEINWSDIDTFDLDSRIHDLYINCSYIDNTQTDAERAKKLSKLNIGGDLCIKSSNAKILDYLAFALKDLSPKDQKYLIFDGKNEEELNKHLPNYKEYNFMVMVSPESIMWLGVDTLKKIDGMINNNDGDMNRMHEFFESLKDLSNRNELDRIIMDLLNRAKDAGVELTTLDKIVYVSNYIQSKFQFCLGLQSNVKGINYETSKSALEEMGLTVDIHGKVYELSDCDKLMSIGVGYCQAFAKLTTLLLNNPRMQVDCRIARTRGNWHTFNLYTIDGKQYIIDNTWCITRNPYRHTSYLRTKAFSDCYLLVGEKTIQGDGHHKHDKDGSLDENDFSREEIQKSVNKLKSLGIIFEYGDTSPIIPQKRSIEIKEP